MLISLPRTWGCGFSLCFCLCWIVHPAIAQQESPSAGQELPVNASQPISETASDSSVPGSELSSTANLSGPVAPEQAEASSVAAGGETQPVELPEGYQEELQARIDLFRSKRLELEKAIGDQREIYIRYLNREEYSPERRQAYFQYRDKVRRLLDETYIAAVAILQIGFDEEAGTFIATMVQHRYGTDIYDAPTMEGAVRLIDGGSHLRFLFETAARSAVVCGEFEMAKNIYAAMEDENQEEVDSRLEFNLEQYREQFMAEAAIREVEIREDRLPRVLLKTTQGDVVVELFLDHAPSTVANFIRLVDDGFYDGLDFYQVIDHLLALTGDPSGTGTGNSGRYLLDEPARPDSRKALRGSLVMAKLPMAGSPAGSFIPNSASSQFAILLLPILSASEEQTVFGTVIEGMDAVSRLRRVDPHKEKKKGELQYPPDSIIEAKVIRRPTTLPEPEVRSPLKAGSGPFSFVLRLRTMYRHGIACFLSDRFGMNRPEPVVPSKVSTTPSRRKFLQGGGMMLAGGALVGSNLSVARGACVRQ